MLQLASPDLLFPFRRTLKEVISLRTAGHSSIQYLLGFQ